MWALRRASINLRYRCLSSGTTQICSEKPEIVSCYLENYKAEFTQYQVIRRFHNTSSSSKSFSVGKIVSSLFGDKSSGDHKNVFDNASSRLETRNDTAHEAASQAEMDDESVSESELSVGVGVADDIDSETDAGEEKYPNTEATSGFTKVVLSAPPKQMSRVLDEWVGAGNEVTRTEVSCTELYLRRHRMFAKTLQLFEWLESGKHLEFTESDYASRVDLEAKVQGIFKAEKYFQQIPESFRSEIVYFSLLKNYVNATSAKKSEELFNKMKNLFPLTCASCNELLFLYKRTNRKKIADVLSLMEKENVKPSNVTYQILIDVKGQANNISEMEQIFEAMKSDGVEPSPRNQASLAKHYAAGGLRVKGDAILKDMEGGDIVKNRHVCQFLFPVYGLLGRDDEVGRIWKECEANPNQEECIAAMKAWGQLNRIEDAEEVFDKMLKLVESPSSNHYAVLLDIYANHRMLSKGEDLCRRMTESGITVRGRAWDAVVRLYAGVGEVEKADAILEEALQQRRGRPQFSSFLKILDGYADKGDVHGAEKIFLKMKRAGYAMQRKPYLSLLYAYVNAKVPAYGFDLRLKSDNVVPDEKMARLLARAAALTKSRWPGCWNDGGKLVATSVLSSFVINKAVQGQCLTVTNKLGCCCFLVDHIKLNYVCLG